MLFRSIIGERTQARSQTRSKDYTLHLIANFKFQISDSETTADCEIVNCQLSIVNFFCDSTLSVANDNVDIKFFGKV